MEISGKVIIKLPPQSGVSQRTGTPWMTQVFVIETSGQYPKKIPFEVFGEDKIKQFDIQMGDKATIQFNIEGSEYNGRWYAHIKCYNYTKVGSSATVPAATPPARPAAAPTHSVPAQPPLFPPEQPAQGYSDDLPF